MIKKFKSVVDYLYDEEAVVVENHEESNQTNPTSRKVEMIKEMLDNKSQNVQLEKVEEVLAEENPEIVQAIDERISHYLDQDNEFKASIIKSLKAFFDKTAKAYADTQDFDISSLDTDNIESVLSGLFIFRVECDYTTRLDAYKRAFEVYSDSLSEFFEYAEMVDEALLEYSAELFLSSEDK